MSNNLVTSIVGHARSRADFTVTPHRLRYNEAASIVPGQFVKLRWPVYPNSFLDLRSIVAEFTLTGSSTDANAYLDGTAQIVFGSLRLVSGSTELMNLTNAFLLFQTLYDLNHQSTMSGAADYAVGVGTTTEMKSWFAGSPRAYLVKLSPDNTILNCDGLLPLYLMSDLTLEITFNTAALSIYSPAPDNSATWTITNLSVHSHYLSSPVLTSYFAQNPLMFHVTDPVYRYNSFTSSAVSQLRFPSAVSSLDKLIVICRNPTNAVAISTQNKARTSISGANLASYQVYLNSQLMYEAPIVGTVEQWLEFREAFPAARTASFYDSSYHTTNNRFGVLFENAPPEFHQWLVSGANTGKINSDTILEITWVTGSPQSFRADGFLLSTVTISLPQSGGDLQKTM